MPVTTPKITSDGGGVTASISLKEGQTIVTTVTGRDADGDGLVYSIVGGLHRYKFKIDLATGVLTFINPPDFTKPSDSSANNVYDVIVQVADGPYSSSTFKTKQAIAVTVTAVPAATMPGVDTMIGKHWQRHLCRRISG